MTDNNNLEVALKDFYQIDNDKEEVKNLITKYQLIADRLDTLDSYYLFKDTREDKSKRTHTYGLGAKGPRVINGRLDELTENTKIITKIKNIEITAWKELLDKSIDDLKDGQENFGKKYTDQLQGLQKEIDNLLKDKVEKLSGKNTDNCDKIITEIEEVLNGALLKISSTAKSFTEPDGGNGSKEGEISVEQKVEKIVVYKKIDDLKKDMDGYFKETIHKSYEKLAKALTSKYKATFGFVTDKTTLITGIGIGFVLGCALSILLHLDKEYPVEPQHNQQLQQQKGGIK